MPSQQTQPETQSSSRPSSMIIEGPAEDVRPTSTVGQPTSSESTGSLQDTSTSTVRVIRKYESFSHNSHFQYLIGYFSYCV